MLMWELLGAVVGAGLASGREIASFFSCCGSWSYAGIVLAGVVLILLADNELPPVWQHRWQGQAWRVLLTLLLVVTGGAMLSGAGEIASRLLPVRSAYWLGMGATLLFAWYLSSRTQSGLAWVSRCLLAVLALLIVDGFRVQPMRAGVLTEQPFLKGAARAVAYGGFNAALMMPVLGTAETADPRRRKRSIIGAGILFVALLAAGNAVLLRHPVLLGEPMPFIRLMQTYGKTGYCLGAASLYLATLSTLTACMRGLGRLGIAAAVCTALLGFTGVVEVAYPILGGGCFLMLAAAKFTNCCRKAFHSSRDML